MKPLPTKLIFTLVELMIVVAIISILAAVALPNLMVMQYRAKVSEGPLNGDGIRTAQIAYGVAHDRWAGSLTGYIPDAPRLWTSLTTQPGIGKDAVPWVGNAGYDMLGWEPDGDVRCVYTGGHGTIEDFGVWVWCDVDGDGNTAFFNCDSCLAEGALRVKRIECSAAYRPTQVPSVYVWTRNHHDARV